MQHGLLGQCRFVCCLMLLLAGRQPAKPRGVPSRAMLSLFICNPVCATLSLWPIAISRVKRPYSPGTSPTPSMPWSRSRTVYAVVLFRSADSSHKARWVYGCRYNDVHHQLWRPEGSLREFHLDHRKLSPVSLTSSRFACCAALSLLPVLSAYPCELRRVFADPSYGYTVALNKIPKSLFDEHRTDVAIAHLATPFKFCCRGPVSRSAAAGCRQQGRSACLV